MCHPHGPQESYPNEPREMTVVENKDWTFLLLIYGYSSTHYLCRYLFIYSLVLTIFLFLPTPLSIDFLKPRPDSSILTILDFTSSYTLLVHTSLVGLQVETYSSPQTKIGTMS